MPPETKTANDDKVEAQKQRAEVCDIQPKDDGHLTCPSEFSEYADKSDDWADYTNYRYPIFDKAHADDAASRWGDESNRTEYTEDEQKLISDRIDKRQGDFGEDDTDKSAPDPTPPAPAAQHKAPVSADRPVLEHKTFAFKATPPTDTSGLNENEFEGYAATFGGAPDSWGDIIEKGAFLDSLADYLASGTICWQHDWTTPIGKPLSAAEDDKGLFIKGRISLTTAGRDALTLLRDDVVTKMSIGYVATSSRTMTDEEGVKLFGEAEYARFLKDLAWYMDGIRVLTGIKLYEISPVTVPANDQADVTGVKGGSLAGLTLDEHFQTVLAAVGEYSTRMASLRELRAKEGRMLSAPNRAKLQTMRDSLNEHALTLDGLLAQSQPDESGDPNDATPDPDDEGKTALEAQRKAEDIRREFLRFQKLQASVNGAV